MAVLAVNRHKELGPYGVEHGAELVAPTMAGNVHGARPVVADIGPHAVHLVDQPVDGARIARNDAGRHDHRVAFHDGKLTVLAGRNAGKRGQGLSLRTCGDDHHALRGNIGDGLVRKQLGRHTHEAKIAAALNIVHEAAAADHNGAVEFAGHVEHHLDALDMAGKKRDDNTAFRFRKNLVERLAHHFF